MTLDDVIKLVDELDQGIDAILPLTPVAALVPLIDALTRVADKLATAQAGKAPALAAEVAAADAAATAAETAKFPAGT